MDMACTTWCNVTTWAVCASATGGIPTKHGRNIFVMEINPTSTKVFRGAAQFEVFFNSIERLTTKVGRSLERRFSRLYTMSHLLVLIEGLMKPPRNGIQLEVSFRARTYRGLLESSTYRMGA